MWLHEVQPGTKEADELARRIMTSLAKAWAWDHGIEAEVIVRRKDEQNTEEDVCGRQEPSSVTFGERKEAGCEAKKNFGSRGSATRQSPT